MFHKHPPPELSHCIYLKNRIRGPLTQGKLSNRGLRRTSVIFVQSIRSSETHYTYQWMMILSSSMLLKRARLIHHTTFFSWGYLFWNIIKHLKVMQLRSFSGTFCFDNDKAQCAWWRIRWVLKLELPWFSSLSPQIFITLDILTTKKSRNFSMKFNCNSKRGCLYKTVQKRENY